MELIFTLKSIYSGATYVAGPFDISGTTSGGATTILLGDNISKASLSEGVMFSNVDDTITGGTVQSVDGTCSNSVSWSVIPSVTPTPTATEIPPTPTPTDVPVCKELTVVQVFTNTNIQYTNCDGSPGTSYLTVGQTNVPIGCVQEGSASGGAQFSYGSPCS